MLISKVLNLYEKHNHKLINLPKKYYANMLQTLVSKTLFFSHFIENMSFDYKYSWICQIGYFCIFMRCSNELDDQKCPKIHNTFMIVFGYLSLFFVVNFLKLKGSQFYLRTTTSVLIDSASFLRSLG